MRPSSRDQLNIVAFQLLKLLVRPSRCEVPVRPGRHGHCDGKGVLVLRFTYRTKTGVLKTVHEVQCDKHLAEWSRAHGEQLELFPT